MNEQKWDLSRLDNGEKSVLRRAAGNADSDLGALRIFYKACGYCDPQLERFWFPMLCMDALWRSEEGVSKKPMEECLRILISDDGGTTASTQHRIEMLLETPYTNDGFLLGKLLNLVKIVKSKTTTKPDFQALADDLRRWNYSDHPVQRRWLRVLYNSKPEEISEEENENAD